MPSGVYKRTPEHNARNSAAQKIVKNRPEVKKKQSISGKKYYCDHPGVAKEIQNRPEVKAKKSVGKKKFHEENPDFQKEIMNRPEVITKQRASHKKFHQEHLGFQKEIYSRAEVREKIKFVHNTLEAIENHRIAATGVYPSKETKMRMRESAKKNWANSEYKEKQLKVILRGQRLLPNKPEKFLLKLFQELFPNQWKYVGDGRNEDSFIAGKCPDFVHVKQKKIIEHFGEYHHGEGVTGIPNDQHKQERIDCFARHGYQTLIIWEHELKDIDVLQDKLQKFCLKKSCQ